MPAILHPLLAMLACSTRQELARQVAYLKEENRILRARIPHRVVTTPQERRRLIRVGRKLGVQLKELVSICGYHTFLRWVRDFEGARYIKRVRKRPSGRPRTADDIRELIVQMRKETNWGYTRIMGELK